MQQKFISQKDSCINNWIRDYKSKNYNYGASRVLISEGAFHTPVFDFDLSCLNGKNITRAWLYTRYEEYPMIKYELSTISYPWDEGTGDGTENPQTDGATFELSGKDKVWPRQGRFSRFIFGNENSTFCTGKPEVLEDNWQRMAINPSMVYERVYDRCHGFTLLDARASFFHNDKISPWEYRLFNKSVYSKESEYPPYILVEYSEDGSCPASGTSLESFSQLDFTYPLEFDYGQMLVE